MTVKSRRKNHEHKRWKGQQKKFNIFWKVAWKEEPKLSAHALAKAVPTCQIWTHVFTLKIAVQTCQLLIEMKPGTLQLVLLLTHLNHKTHFHSCILMELPLFSNVSTTAHAAVQEKVAQRSASQRPLVFIQFLRQQPVCLTYKWLQLIPFHLMFIFFSCLLLQSLISTEFLSFLHYKQHVSMCNETNYSCVTVIVVVVFDVTVTPAHFLQHHKAGLLYYNMWVKQFSKNVIS